MHCSNFNMIGKNRYNFYRIVHADVKKEPMPWRQAVDVTNKLTRRYNTFTIYEYEFKEVGKETIDDYSCSYD